MVEYVYLDSRTQYDGVAFSYIFSLLHYNECGISVSWFCDHRICISLSIGCIVNTGTGCTAASVLDVDGYAERTVSCELNIYSE